MEKQITQLRKFGYFPVTQRGSRSGHRHPCINVKVRHGFEVIKPEEWETLRADALVELPLETRAGFTREWCEAYSESKPEQFAFCWSDACESGLESARRDCEALFGSRVTCELEGRSGGWLVVHGLPDVEEWSYLVSGDKCRNCERVLGPSDIEIRHCEECGDKTGPELDSLRGTAVGGARFADGTPLSDDACIWERWAFFEEACASTVRDIPYLCAFDLGANIFAREETTRNVELLRAWDSREWDLIEVAIPMRCQSNEEIVEFATKNLGVANPPESIVLLAVYADPKD